MKKEAFVQKIFQSFCFTQGQKRFIGSGKCNYFFLLLSPVKWACTINNLAFSVCVREKTTHMKLWKCFFSGRNYCHGSGGASKHRGKILLIKYFSNAILGKEVLLLRQNIVKNGSLVCNLQPHGSYCPKVHFLCSKLVFTNTIDH